MWLIYLFLFSKVFYKPARYSKLKKVLFTLSRTMCTCNLQLPAAFAVRLMEKTGNCPRLTRAHAHEDAPHVLLFRVIPTDSLPGLLHNVSSSVESSVSTPPVLIPRPLLRTEQHCAIVCQDQDGRGVEVVLAGKRRERSAKVWDQPMLDCTERGKELTTQCKCSGIWSLV